ncbi:hypothetical protein NPX13_g4086 [Xylaria arbuscula]|uniref:Uncharacterized protein n=1 Tax=Xylaria arbuscula TaxID=114810 RepID=A0A9W8NHH4_9PEZI|nr:hypothetical protein NPX13_g4086 [Xylaria arbuscula]
MSICTPTYLPPAWNTRNCPSLHYSLAAFSLALQLDGAGHSLDSVDGSIDVRGDQGSVVETIAYCVGGTDITNGRSATGTLLTRSDEQWRRAE